MSVDHLQGEGEHVLGAMGPQGFVLARRRDEANEVFVWPGARARLNGRLVDDVAMMLRPGDVANVGAGRVDYQVQVVEAEPMVTPPWRERLDSGFARLVFALLLLQLGLLGSLWLWPEQRKPALVERPPAIERVRDIVLTMKAKPVIGPKAAQAGGEAARLSKGKPKEEEPESQAQAANKALARLGLQTATPSLGLRQSAASLGRVRVGQGGEAPVASASGLGRSPVQIQPAAVVYEGALTRDEIQSVIDRYLSQIKFCYEREVQKDPELAGKLLARWVISPEGDAKERGALQNTLRNAQVEQCVLRVIGRMVFPKPRGGGVVTVSYPFVFSSAGA